MYQVRSLNAQLPLSEAECDALLPTTTDAAGRTLAHRYHRWPAEPRHDALRSATCAVSALLRTALCLPILEAVGQSLVRHIANIIVAPWRMARGAWRMARTRMRMCHTATNHIAT